MKTNGTMKTNKTMKTNQTTKINKQLKTKKAMKTKTNNSYIQTNQMDMCHKKAKTWIPHQILRIKTPD